MRWASAAAVAVVVLTGCGASETAGICVPRAVTSADQYCVSGVAVPNGHDASKDVACRAGDLFVTGGCAPTQKISTADILLTNDRPVTDDTGHPVGWRCVWWSSDALPPYITVLEAHVCCQKPVSECLEQE